MSLCSTKTKMALSSQTKENDCKCLYFPGSNLTSTHDDVHTRVLRKFENTKGICYASGTDTYLLYFVAPLVSWSNTVYPQHVKANLDNLFT